MTKIVILVPYRGDGGRRDQLWAFVGEWMYRYDEIWGTSWGIYEGESPEGSFNRGAAINDAAKRAGDWDIAVIHDADTICDPLMMNRAVIDINKSHEGVIYPYETYTYLDEWSSNKLLQAWRDTPVFVSPELHPDQGFRTTVRHHHVSGAVVVSRRDWEAVGGFVELLGWGAEDLIMHTLFKTFASEPKWLKGGAYHLYHPASRNDGSETDQNNHQILADVLALSVVPDKLRQYLRDGGHLIPDES